MQLKPCPFCGEKEHLYPCIRRDGSVYAIDCLGCGMDFTPREGRDAVEAWNRRAPLSDETDKDIVMSR